MMVKMLRLEVIFGDLSQEEIMFGDSKDGNKLER